MKLAAFVSFPIPFAHFLISGYLLMFLDFPGRFESSGVDCTSGHLGCKIRRLKAHLHVKREGTARLETSTGSRLQTKSPVYTYKFCNVPDRKRHGT